MSENFNVKHRCKILKKIIEEACVMLGLNLCVYDGKKRLEALGYSKDD